MSENLDWYAQFLSSIYDNTFTAKALGTGIVGELHGEEGNQLCQENDLSYIPHIASWKLNEQHDIFAVSLFASGHRMLYGYEMEKSYDDENWMVDELNEKFMQIRVDKIFEEQAYTFMIRFEVIR